MLQYKFDETEWGLETGLNTGYHVEWREGMPGSQIQVFQETKIQRTSIGLEDVKLVMNSDEWQTNIFERPQTDHVRGN